MTIRRIVTGIDAQDRSVFVSDTKKEPLQAAALPGAEMHYVWGADEHTTVPSDGSEPAWKRHFPETHGFRFIVFTMPPRSVAGHDQPLSNAEIQEADNKFPGFLDTFDPNTPGMHVSTTLDIAIVLEGRVRLELDSGETRELETGDVLIQNGTKHRWSNPGDQPATFATVLLGANARSPLHR